MYVTKLRNSFKRKNIEFEFEFDCTLWLLCFGCNVSVASCSRGKIAFIHVFMGYVV